MASFRSFFQRFGHLGVCVLPAEVLSNDLLRVDPETQMIPLSLRKSASALGLCFARVLRSFADGLYWADVSATPDLVDAQRVVFTEEQLYAALPWDIRLVDRHPGDICKLLAAHAQGVRPAQPLAEEMQPQDGDQLYALTPVPIVPLQPLDEAAVVVTTSELQEAFDPRSPDDDDDFPGKALLKRISKKVGRPTGSVKHIGSCAMQQAFLRAMIDALMARLYQAQDQVTALSLKARCAMLALLQRWQRFSRQRIVNAVPIWSEERQGILWQLTVGVPMEVLA